MNGALASILVIALFVIGGVTLLVMACVRPMLLTEKILTISIGSFGLLWAFIRALLLRSRIHETSKVGGLENRTQLRH